MLSAPLSGIKSLMLDKVMRQTVDQIWDVYDADGNGVMDFEETKVFLNDYMGKFGSGEKLSNRELKILFKEIDEDGSGELDKEEIIVLLKAVCNMKK